LVARHGSQMRAYRDVMERAFPGVPVEALLFSTHLRATTYTK